MKSDGRARNGGARSGAGRRPDLLRRLAEVTRELDQRPERFSDAELNTLRSAVISLVASIDVEFTRRVDANDPLDE